MQHTQAFLQLFLKGLGIGSVDIIPGVSGGTIALLTGIYEELLIALQSFNITALRLLRVGKFKPLWQHLHGNFLLPLVAGIGVSLFTTVRLVTWLLNHYPIQSWSFFGGLILASSVTLYRKIKQWSFLRLLVSLGGILLAYALTSTTPMHTPDSAWFIALAGGIAVCAMILPGISGSFMLLLLGKYTFMLDALQGFKLGILIPFVGGGMLGLLSFSRLIAWLLCKVHDYTVALLAGFMLGSLNQLWPWKQLIERSETGGSPVSFMQNISPVKYQEVFGQNPLVLQALLWISVGVLIVVGIEKMARSKRSKQRST